MPDLYVNVFRINRTPKKDSLVQFLCFFLSQKKMLQDPCELFFKLYLFNIFCPKPLWSKTCKEMFGNVCISASAAGCKDQCSACLPVVRAMFSISAGCKNNFLRTRSFSSARGSFRWCLLGCSLHDKYICTNTNTQIQIQVAWLENTVSSLFEHVFYPTIACLLSRRLWALLTYCCLP